MNAAASRVKNQAGICVIREVRSRAALVGVPAEWCGGVRHSERCAGSRCPESARRPLPRAGLRRGQRLGRRWNRVRRAGLRIDRPAMRADSARNTGIVWEVAISSTATFASLRPGPQTGMTASTSACTASSAASPASPCRPSAERTLRRRPFRAPDQIRELGKCTPSRRHTRAGG